MKPASLASALRVIHAVEAHHSLRKTEIFSAHHHDGEHVSEDERCDERLCFEPFDICNGCGAHWPCSTIRGMRTALADAA